MKFELRKAIAVLLCMALVLNLAGAAFAASISSSPFRLPTVKTRPVEEVEPEQPTEEEPAEEQPTEEEPTEEEPTEEQPIEEEPIEEQPTEELPTEEQPTEELPTEEQPTEEEPAEEQPSEEPTDEMGEQDVSIADQLTYERDENGDLVLDENGNPVPIVPAGWDVPVRYERDENGNLVLDENGNPIVLDSVPEGSEILLTLEDKLDPNRSIDIYVSWNGEKAIGASATLTAVLYGYDNAVYTLQWQRSKDNASWSDIPGANGSRFTVKVTDENCTDYWRVTVTITDVK